MCGLLIFGSIRNQPIKKITNNCGDDEHKTRHNLISTSNLHEEQSDHQGCRD